MLFFGICVNNVNMLLDKNMYDSDSHIHIDILEMNSYSFVNIIIIQVTYKAVTHLNTFY